MPNPDWEARHAKTVASGSAELTASSLIVEFTTQLQPGRALDLACGLGRHSLWLARMGWHVTAVDRSRVAIEFLQRAAAAQGTRIDAVVADLESGGLVIRQDHPWNLIVVYNYWQRGLMASVRSGVSPGGFVLASARLTGSFRVEPGELRSAFSDWEILHYREHQNADAGHATAQIAARRPTIA